MMQGAAQGSDEPDETVSARGAKTHQAQQLVLQRARLAFMRYGRATSFKGDRPMMRASTMSVAVPLRGRPQIYLDDHKCMAFWLVCYTKQALGPRSVKIWGQVSRRHALSSD